ncbi:hypothetical protein [Breznakia pachnodae]|uniref:Uncharacterized protein n=1 Tax=Breznakia pachnodae TaxID=265178 RepID=A0ABU0E0D1_9FIRM|nr:hypothetical protein [Breznakia pachnodae]MDQ0360005.1 hypothetical protein [Breznakia pachnodae]
MRIYLKNKNIIEFDKVKMIELVSGHNRMTLYVAWEDNERNHGISKFEIIDVIAYEVGLFMQQVKTRFINV